MLLYDYFTTSLQSPFSSQHPMSMFTSGYLLWKRGIIVGMAVVLGITLVSATGRSSSTKTLPQAGGGLPKDFVAPTQVRGIIQRACMDCHSEATVWPWYSYIPPVSWQVHEDVHKGRAFMDLSHWGDYTPEEQRGFVSQIARITRAGVMPPSKYLWMHRDARLSDADLDLLAAWAANKP